MIWAGGRLDLLRWTALLAAVLAIALAAGRLITIVPLLALAPCGALILAGMVGSAYVRFLVVILGGLMVFQSSDGLSASKMAYLVAMLLSIAIAAVRWWPTQSRRSGLMDPLIGYSLAGIGLLPATLLVAQAHATLSTAWLRDSISYLLLLSAPLIAADAQHGRSARWIPPTFAGVGVLSAISTAVGWASRRGYSQLPIDRILLSSNWPAYAVAFAAFAIYLANGARSTKWLALLGAIVGIGAISGSRSIFAPYLSFAVLLLVNRRQIGTRVGRSIGAALALAGALGVAAALVAQSSIVRVGELQQRYAGISSFLSNRSADASYGDRTVQFHLAWKLFKASPIAGLGPGHAFLVWRARSHLFTSSLTMDTALSLLTKFGVIGLIYALGLAWHYGRLSARLRASGAAVSADLIVLWGTATIIMAPFTAFFDDKGYALGLALLLAFALHRGPDSAPSRERERSGASVGPASTTETIALI